jgi:hypothetical protein
MNTLLLHAQAQGCMQHHGHASPDAQEFKEVDLVVMQGTRTPKFVVTPDNNYKGKARSSKHCIDIDSNAAPCSEKQTRALYISACSTHINAFCKTIILMAMLSHVA